MGDWIFGAFILICILITGFGMCVLYRPARGGQAIENFGVGWRAIIGGVIFGALAGLARAI